MEFLMKVTEKRDFRKEYEAQGRLSFRAKRLCL
ncbi:MAG: hypothetical protein ACI9YB_002799 [Halioglobus sp.]